MDNSLLDIGTQCSVDSCSYHDFLPIFCPNCSKYFCKDHIHSGLHSCPLHTPEHNVQQEKLQRCALDNCNNLSLDAYNPSTAVACPNCDKSFCAEHRHPISHKCTVATTLAGPSIVTKNEKARALLAKMPSSSTTKSSLKQTTKLPTNPAKLAAHHKVEVMKMRHKAIPLDPKDKATPVPLDQRVHIKVQHDDKVNVFWVRKTLIAGRALDLLCNQFGITHNSTPIRLVKDGAGAQLQNDKLLSEQVDDGSPLYITLDP